MKNYQYFFLLIFTILLTAKLPAQHGLKAEYYDGTDFDRLVATRTDDKIDMYWNDTPPVKGIDPHKCSIRWTGRLRPPETGTYTFSARVDDGIRVWVGGKIVIDDWGLNDVGVFKGEVKMEAGKFYDLKVEYFNALIEGEITLLWNIPDRDESWFSHWWGDEAEVIEPVYFFQPKGSLPEPMVERQPVREEEKPESAPKKRSAPKPEPVAPQKEVANTETIRKYTPKNIQFEQAKAAILPESYTELEELAGFLKRQPHLKVTVEGHTDNVGDAYKNVLLSQQRADAVAAYLIETGVREDRIEARGYGGARPLVKSDGRKYHPENRRVAFIIE